MTFAEVLPWCVGLGGNAAFFELGRRLGTSRERARCAGLCAQTFIGGTLSATTRRVYRSILDGHHRVISEDAFFGPRGQALK